MQLPNVDTRVVIGGAVVTSFGAGVFVGKYSYARSVVKRVNNYGPLFCQAMRDVIQKLVNEDPTPEVVDEIVKKHLNFMNLASRAKT